MEKIARKNYNNELEIAFHQIIKKMYDGCKNFDNGETHYATDLANYLYMLCAEEGSQVSILQQLGIKSKIQLYSTVSNKEIGYKFYFSGSPLLKVIISEKDGKPNLGFGCLNKNEDRLHLNYKKSYKEWWRERIVFKSNGSMSLQDTSKNKQEGLLRRCDIVKLVRNQEGGGHYDKEISEKLSQIKDNFMGLDFKSENDQTSITINFEPKNYNNLDKNILNFEEYPFYIIRQITHEFLLSIQEVDINSARKWLHLQ